MSPDLVFCKGASSPAQPLPALLTMDRLFHLGAAVFVLTLMRRTWTFSLVIPDPLVYWDLFFFFLVYWDLN